jgi:catechol-2,3-dioxygenase
LSVSTHTFGSRRSGSVLWRRARPRCDAAPDRSDFLIFGGYHHHLAVNVWHSNSAGIRNDKRAGLDWFAMEINDQPTIDGVQKHLEAAGITIDAIPGGFSATDPWGTCIRFTTAP